MKTIFVCSQKELDSISPDTKGIDIRIKSGSEKNPIFVNHHYSSPIEVYGYSVIYAHGESEIVAHDNCCIYAFDACRVDARDHSVIKAYGDCHVNAYDNSVIKAHGDCHVNAADDSNVYANCNCSVFSYGTSSIIANGNSCIRALGSSCVEAYEHSRVEAYEHSRVKSYEHSRIIAMDYSHILAMGVSSVEAYNTSHIESYGHSYIEAYENSYVIAHDHSRIKAHGNSHVIDFLIASNINLYECASVCSNPEEIKEFMDFYRIEHDKTTATFFKAVHKKMEVVSKNQNSIYSYRYISSFDSHFEYKIGEKVISNGFDNNIMELCGAGIHVSDKHSALKFGMRWNDLALLEVRVKIKDILLPKHSNGAIRVPEVEVIREVPLKECGLVGKFILQKNKNINE